MGERAHRRMGEAAIQTRYVCPVPADNAVQPANRPFAGAPIRPFAVSLPSSWLLLSRCRQLNRIHQPLGSSDGNGPTETDPNPSSDNREVTE
jgi:hypothetical protein